MPNEQQPFTSLYLAADEYMQLYLTCSRLPGDHQDELSFLIQVTCLAVAENTYAHEIPIQLNINLSKTGNGMAIELDVPNIVNVTPIRIKQIADYIQNSPTYIQIILDQLHEIQLSDEVHNFYQAGLVKAFFLSRVPNGIIHYSINRDAKDLYWIYKNNCLISNISPFTMDDAGGHLSFSVQTGFTNGVFMQCYDVECRLHLFMDGDKLGYYFELYLEEDNYLHQRLYRELPEHFMLNKRFLNRILQLMRQHQKENYTDYLQNLIVQFQAAI